MKPRTQALLAAFVLFVLGLGLGSLCTAFVAVRSARRSIASGEGLGVLQRGLERFHQDLVTELHPSPAQNQELARQFSELSKQLLETRRRHSRELLLELRSGGRSIRSGLDESQRATYDLLVRRMILRYGVESRGSAEADIDTTERTQDPAVVK